MTSDPYPDLAGAEPHEPATVDRDGAADDRPELDEADSRLLDALSQAGPAVVSAVEDQPRRVSSPRSAPAGRSPLAPEFREPTA